MSELRNMVLYLLITATMQNLVLTAGFGSSTLAYLVRRPRYRRTYTWLLLVFTVATTALFYPVDLLIPFDWQFRMLRPLAVVVLTALLYIATVLVAIRRYPTWYRRVRRLLPLAAFNNIVVGAALVTNHQVAVSFFPAVGIAAGAALGFVLVSALSAEALERMDNPDMPAAFRGLPGMLVYLGLFALALMGFGSVLNLI